jgi:aminopeptidase N
MTEVSINIPKNTVAMLLNYDDLTFAVADLDEKSRIYFSDNLKKVEDSLSRALVWKSFYNMLIDSKITSKEFIDFILKNISNEKSDSIF